MAKYYFIILFLALSALLAAKDFGISSPNNKIEVIISPGKEGYGIIGKINGAKAIELKELYLQLRGAAVIPNLAGKISVKRKTYSGIKSFPVPVKSKTADYRYNAIELTTKNGGLEVRVFDDGIAYRWITSVEGEVTVETEGGKIYFPDGSMVYYPSSREKKDPFVSHFEESFEYLSVSSLSKGRFASLPILAETGDKMLIAVSEANLRDYPGLHLKADGNNGLVYTFARYPLEIIPGRKKDRDEIILKRADYIAITEGKREFPWRVFALAEKPADILGDQLVALLSGTPEIEDVSWIKPGKVAWDWWNANNLYGVPFKSGINTATYKYYIDFASKYGLEYVILDEGWSETTDLLKISPEIDIKEICGHAKKKGVGVILWTLWKPLDKNRDEVLDAFKKWGVAGIKVDFMQRDDQWMVNYYERIAKEAAKREMLVDFHGAFKPSGLRMRYPNVLTYEGVKGLEHNKWSTDITPSHDVIIPFTRMFAGPMDYTPGAMVNAGKKNFRIVFERPMSQGTRCHQLAQYVVYESPLQMLADSPSRYLRDTVYTEFLSRIPTVWDETAVIDAVVGGYILIARRKGNVWYLAGLNGDKPVSLKVKPVFLEKGRYRAVIFRDGLNADRYAEDYEVKKIIFDANTAFNMDIISGGGWVAEIIPYEGP